MCPPSQTTLLTFYLGTVTINSDKINGLNGGASNEFTYGTSNLVNGKWAKSPNGKSPFFTFTHQGFTETTPDFF